MNKIMVVVGVFGLLLIWCIGVIDDTNVEEVENNMDKVYQGPVPQGFDLNHFRNTGETIAEEIE